ncbi:MAG TPA: tRNA 4-thiouridine(8) synthase ThiI, partial [Methanolinea sp.]|nr:tRNA 4-thiouridine(8) synthase ThiI [Methanolinea sp.]
MELVLIRYGELFLKSEPVKRHFIGLLLRNLKKALDSKGLEHRFEVQRGRILVAGDDPGAIASTASRVFGVVDVSVSLRTDPNPERLCKSALSRAQESLKPGMSFAVRAKRQGVHGITSQE